jgi:hypothetical protein
MLKVIESAKRQAEAMPDWMRNFLVLCGRPTVSVPRPLIIREADGTTREVPWRDD